MDDDKALRILFTAMALLYTGFIIGIWEYIVKPVVNFIGQII